jgi:metal-responsive CopG/Arc/MetJ family transcriptional regulator
MRTLVDIPERQITALANICANQRLSRAEAIRQAIALYIEQNKPARDDVFGLWSKEPRDGMAYQEQVRSEW